MILEIIADPRNSLVMHIVLLYPLQQPVKPGRAAAISHRGETCFDNVYIRQGSSFLMYGSFYLIVFDSNKE